VPRTIIHFQEPCRVNIVLAREANRTYCIRSVRDDIVLSSYVGHYSEVMSNDFVLPARKTRECQVPDIGTYFRIPDERAWTSQIWLQCFRLYRNVLNTSLWCSLLEGSTVSSFWTCICSRLLPGLTYKQSHMTWPLWTTMGVVRHSVLNWRGVM